MSDDPEEHYGLVTTGRLPAETFGVFAVMLQSAVARLEPAADRA